MAKKVKLSEYEVRIARKSQIKLSPEQKELNDNIFFIVNQLYNFLIEKLVNDKEFQDELISLNYAEFKEVTRKDKNKIEYKEQVFIVKNQGAIRNYITPIFNKYMEDRKLSTKCLSKQLQLKLEDFLEAFNKTNLSPIKSHNFKLTSLQNKGSFTTDSAISLYSKLITFSSKQNRFLLDKTKLIHSKRMKKKIYFVKIGTQHYELMNDNLDFNDFKHKKVTLSRDNGKYFISLSGIKILEDKKLDKLDKKDNKKCLKNCIGVDVNFQNISFSNGKVVYFDNMQNKLNLFTEKFDELQKEKSKKEEINKEVLKTICKTDKIDMYIQKYKNSKRQYKMTKEAKKIYKSILSSDKDYQKLLKRINKLYKKRTNVQNDFYQKLANKLSIKVDLLLLEDLNINNMVNSDVNNLNLYNASLGKLLTILSNKMLTIGKIAHKVESFYTSQDCSTKGCNYRNSNLKKEDRIWTCPKCFTLHKRDYNAAKNVEYKGIKNFQALVSEPKLTVKKTA